MTFPAANVRFCHRLLSLRAISRHAHARFEDEKRAVNYSIERHVLTRISSQNLWDGARGAQVRFPRLGVASVFQQPAFFVVPATVIIPIKITAFLPGWCTHISVFRAWWVMFSKQCLALALGNGTSLPNP